VTLNLKLSSETEAKIRQQGALAGQNVEAFVRQAVAEKLEEAELPSSPPRNGGDWAKRLRACIDLHPVATHVVDDSRESIWRLKGAEYQAAGKSCGP
jgi:hypothetical protein